MRIGRFFVNNHYPDFAPRLDRRGLPLHSRRPRRPWATLLGLTVITLVLASHTLMAGQIGAPSRGVQDDIKNAVVIGDEPSLSLLETSNVGLGVQVILGDVVICEKGVNATNDGCTDDVISDVLRFYQDPNGTGNSRYEFFSDPNKKDEGSLAVPGGLGANKTYISEDALKVPLKQPGPNGGPDVEFAVQAVVYAPQNGLIPGTQKPLFNSYEILSIPEPPAPAVNLFPVPSPRDGKKDPAMTFDASTGTLSFEDSAIDFLNLAGDTSMNPAFASDPLLGATISVDNFQLAGPEGSGFLFTGGTMTISNNGMTLFSADVPELLIDDSATPSFGLNIFAPLGIGAIDLSDSPFLTDYFNYWDNHPDFPPELMGQTVAPVTDMIRNGQSFTTEVDGYSTGFSYETPEPGTLVLFGAGIAVLASRAGGRFRLKH